MNYFSYQGTCKTCKKEFPIKPTGRTRETCSDPCRQALYRYNQKLKALQQEFFENNPKFAGPQAIIRK